VSLFRAKKAAAAEPAAPKPPAKPSLIDRFFRAVKRSLLFFIGIVLVIQLWFLGWILWWKETPPQETHFMSLRLDELQQKNPAAELQYQWVPYARISPHLKRAIIASEDAHFLQHNGFDWQGIQDALEKNQKKGRFVAGGSTISQQLAKNLFLSPERSMLRKGQEAVITVMLESLWDKEHILEVYLNVIEWGNGVFGAEAAAQHYYGISAERLSAAQAARLAAMVPNPRFYDQRRNDTTLAHKTRTIQARMSASRLPSDAPPPKKED
jgi:monofunctional biosynthetic peptidoglycan transglycosylase